MTKVANDLEAEVCFNLEELQAIADAMHGKTAIRFNPDNPWTAEKHLALRARIDAELALLKVEKVIL